MGQIADRIKQKALKKDCECRDFVETTTWADIQRGFKTAFCEECGQKYEKEIINEGYYRINE